MRSQRGQSLLETVVGLVTLITFVTALMSGLYALWVKERLSLLTYEALICQETRGENLCDVHFLKLAGHSLPFGKVRILQQLKTVTDRTWVVHYDGNPVSFSIQQSLTLPLK